MAKTPAFYLLEVEMPGILADPSQVILQNPVLQIDPAASGLHAGGPGILGGLRARQQGFTEDVYHATAGPEFPAFSNAASVRQGYGAATHVAASPALANMFARQFPPEAGARVIPLKLRLGNVADAATFKEFANRNDWDIPRTTQDLINAGYDTVKYNHGTFYSPDESGRLVQSQPGEDLAYAVLKPENLRGRFSNFDPLDIGKNTIMGSPSK